MVDLPTAMKSLAVASLRVCFVFMCLLYPRFPEFSQNLFCNSRLTRGDYVWYNRRKYAPCGAWLRNLYKGRATHKPHRKVIRSQRRQIAYAGVWSAVENQKIFPSFPCCHKLSSINIYAPVCWFEQKYVHMFPLKTIRRYGRG